jgi:hypothetical protein
MLRRHESHSETGAGVAGCRKTCIFISMTVRRRMATNVTDSHVADKSRRVIDRLIAFLTRMFTLKQRLTALSQPSSSSPSPRSSPVRRKFSAPWVKRTVAPYGHQNEFTGEDRLQLIISKMIYQAGVDYECACFHVMMHYSR